MTKPKYIIATLFSVLILLISETVTGQSTEVYSWIGNSGSWHNANNWTVNGNSATRPPSKKDIAYIHASQPIEISVDENAFAEALTTTGEGTITFKAIKFAKIEIASSCILSDQTTVNKNVKVELKGIGNENYLQIPTSLENQITVRPDAPYQNIREPHSSRSTCSHFTISPDPTRPTCNGFHDGIASVEEPTDGVGPYTYQWIGGPASRQWTNVGAGTFTIIIFDVGQGALCNMDVFVNEPGPLTVFSMNATPPTCPDGCDGTASPIVIGGSGGYVLNWSSGETGLNATELCPTFNLNIVDVAGCVYDTAYTFTNAPEAVNFEAIITDIDCFGNNNGAIDLTVQGGTGSFTYSWIGPDGFTSTTKDITGLKAGDYTIQVEDANNCTADATFSISENELLEATLTKDDNICGGEMEGAIQVNPTGGLPPYAYSWSGPNGFIAADQNLSELESGLYEVTITDDALCTYIAQITIDEPTEIQIDLTSGNVLCIGGATGSATASASGGTPGYTYQWLGPDAYSAVGPGITNVPAGVYEVTVTDVNLCTSQESIEITEPDAIQGDFSIGTITCHNGNDGSIQTVISGGTPNYTIAWSGPNGFTSSDLNISGLSAGVYTATIVDANSCEITETVEILNPDPMVLTADITPSSCAIGSDGGIVLTITGGAEPYFYSWTGPGGFASNAQNLNNRSGGNYSVSVTDANMCVVSGSFAIPSPDPLVADIVKENASCFGVTDGSIQVTASGGLEPYTYLWVGPAGFISQDQNLSDLLGGSYSVQITDANGCIGFFSTTISQPPKMNITGPVTPATCFGGSDGSIQSIVNGGTPGYTYSWVGSNGFATTTKNISGVPAGVYILTVTDAIGCSKSREYTVGEPLEITVDATLTDVVCAGGSDGGVQLEISNGVAPYSVAWSGPGGFTSSNINISGLAAGVYTAVITDANACEVTETVEILHADPMVLSAEITPSSCAIGSDGGIILTVTGGAEPYFFSWTGPGGFSSNAQNLNNRSGGTYSVTVTDANMCEVSGSYTITSPDPLAADIVKQNASCFGVTDGSLQVTASGGLEPYTYLWVGPAGFFSQDQNISNLLGGSYSVQIIDANGCMGFFSATISQPPKMNITGPVTPVTCFEGSDGSIQSIVNGGTPGYTYSWTGPNGFSATTKDISGVPAGEYTLTVTDAIGCSKSRDYTIAEPLEILVDATITDVVCAGASDGEIQIDVSNGVPPFTYLWTDTGGFTSNNKDITDLSGGTYNLTIKDGNNCEVTHAFEVVESVEIIIDSDVTHISCAGEADGEVSISVEGGLEPYAFNWSGPNGYTSTEQSLENLEAGLYELNLIDGTGCEVNLAVNITAPEELAVQIIPQDISCFGAQDGSLLANITGGIPPYIISWSGPEGYTSTEINISNLLAGDYDIEITDSQGCSIGGSQSIDEPFELEMTVEINQPACLVNDGSLTANVTGGTVAANYTYSWQNQNGTELGTTPTISNLAPGDFTIIVTDDNGCEVQETIELKRITFDVAAQINSVKCFNGSDGSISITPVGGTAPFTYEWIGPDNFTSTGNIIENLIAGQYEIDVEDATGCIFNMVYDVDQPDELDFTANVLPESCMGEGNGSISLEVIGGTPGYSVSWTGPEGFTANGLNITGLVPGPYNASVVDINGCIGDTVFDVGVGNQFNIDLTAIQPICAGEMSGSIDMEVTATPGAPDIYTYSWTGPNGFMDANQNITNLEAGKYIVSVTNADGCTRLDSIDIAMPDSILIEVDITESNCLQSDGAAAANVDGGVGALSVRWLDNQGNELATGLDLTGVSSGIYIIEVSDDAGCVISQTVVISDISGSISGTVTQPVCAGGDDGSINIQVINGTDPFTYEWTQGGAVVSNDENIENLEAGIYNVTVTDGNGCIYSASFNVNDPASIQVDADIMHVSCNPTGGSISLDITHAALPVAVDWSGPDGFVATGEHIQDLTIGVYTYSITTADNCFTTGSFEVESVPEMVVSAEVKDVLCGGESTGYIDISVTGGASPISYSWSDSTGEISTIQDVADIPAGIYTVVINDANECSITEVYEIAENEPVEAIFTIIAPDCDIDNGSISVVLSGGVVTTDYFISWTDSDGNPYTPTADLTDLGVGIYVFSGSDDNGCSIDTTIVLSNPDADIEALITHTSCPDVSDGTIALNLSGVAEPYTVTWSGPDGFTSNDQNLTGLEPGAYEYTIIGSNNCEYIGDAIINPADPIDVTATISNACFETDSGEIELEVTGANDPYEFQWTGPDGFTAESQNIDNLVAGTYEVVITYSSTCTETLDFTVIENPEIILDFTQTDISCFGESSGSINLSISGGFAPYNVNWTGPDGFISQQLNITDLQAGDYLMSVIDETGCVTDTMLTILEPQPLEVLETVVSAGCTSPTSLGMIELLVSGGTPNYFISWTGPDGFTSTDFAMIDLEPGLYTYTITDESGCTLENEIEIFDVEPIEIDLVIQQVSCFGETDGSAIVTISGGLEPYDIIWQDTRDIISEVESVDDLPEGSYTVTVTDSAGCSVSQSFEIIEPDSITIEIVESNDASCNTSLDGSISIALSGGQTPYTYTWTGINNYESSDQNLEGLAPGHYDLQVEDMNGCIAHTSVELTYMLEISANAGEDMIICISDLPIQIVGTGVNVDEFSWIDLEGNLLNESAELTFTESIGTHSLVFIGSNGLCSVQDTLDITILANPIADAGRDQEVFTEELFTLGGNPTSVSAESYLWSPNPTQSLDTSLPNPSGYLLESTEFVVEVTDANGCVGTDTVFVTVLPDVIITSGFTPNGDGVNDTWIIDNIELFPNNVVHVFNRWGQAVFEQKSYNSGSAWDGTFEGKKLPVGTYYYTIELKDERFPEPLTGPITIYR